MVGSWLGLLGCWHSLCGTLRGPAHNLRKLATRVMACRQTSLAGSLNLIDAQASGLMV